MSESTVSLASLSPADILALIAQVKAAEKEQRKASSAARVKMRASLRKIVPGILAEFGTRIMPNGSIGQSLGGTIVVIDPESGNKRELRVSMRMAWVDTIPVRTTTVVDEENEDEAALGSASDEDVDDAQESDAPAAS